MTAPAELQVEVQVEVGAVLLMFALALPGNELVLSLRAHINSSAGKARAPTELQVDVGVVLLLFETCLLSLCLVLSLRVHSVQAPAK